MKQLTKLIKSFGYAGTGIANTVKSEQNMRIHICALAFVIISGIMQRLDATAWAIEILCCAGVISLELVNTALENACDAVTKQTNRQIKLCKDAAAGAVLIMAAGAVAVWLILLLRGRNGVYLENIKASFASCCGYIVAAAWAILSLIFVFYRRRK